MLLTSGSAAPDPSCASWSMGQTTERLGKLRRWSRTRSDFTISSYCPEHYYANETAEWSHYEPISAELPSARRIAANDTRLRGQNGLPSIALLNCKIPDGAGEAPARRAEKAFLIEGLNIAGRPPESPRDSEHNFPTRFFGQPTESRFNNCPKSDLLRRPSNSARPQRRYTSFANSSSDTPRHARLPASPASR